MAIVQYISQTPFIQAEHPEERDLLDHGRENGGVIVLLGGEYRVDRDRLLLPETSSELQADRVRVAFEASARSHQQARDKRRAFRLLKL